ncbi:MAG TPA: hypothetical protein DDW88_02450, partial [Treponema sp.]|nr:hypothetical protein [Treponema sp.]
MHRENDLPAVEYANGDKEWWKNGQLHRDNDKPAIEDKNGTKKWYINDKLHREGDLPAVEWSNGDKDWYKNGKRVAASHLFVSQEKHESNNLTKEATMPKKETNVEQEKGAAKKPAPFNIINAKNFAQSIKNGNSVLLTESNPELVYSLATGKPFSGPNQLLAQQQLADKGLKTNEIVTFKQANEMGAGVKAGSKHAVVLSSYDAEKNESSNYFYFTKEDTTIKSESKKLTFENVKPIECTSSEPEKYIADYLAASYLGVEFKAADGVKKEFQEKLSNQLDQAYEQKKFGKM